MKTTSKIITTAAAALALLAMATPALAGEYCKTDSSGMRGCGYETMAQCQASASAQNGTCARDPFYTAPQNALAYQPAHHRLHPAKKSAAR
ncbi:DUF3551 domain-containing protein [Bradyrhizobium sp.]|uniref:DUF3551 domain-containing protein n=1 Tax=Bradyrhizobium sp. TaxID=376 RepID=UPI003C47172E